MMECGEGREGLLPGTEVGVGEKVEEEAGEIGDEKSHPGYLGEGEMGRDEVAKLKEEEGGRAGQYSGNGETHATGVPQAQTLTEGHEGVHVRNLGILS